MRLKASFSGDVDSEELDVRRQKALEVMQQSSKSHPNEDLMAEMAKREEDAVRELEAEEAEEEAAAAAKSGVDFAASLNAKPHSAGGGLEAGAEKPPSSHHRHKPRMSKQLQLQAVEEAAKAAAAQKALVHVMEVFDPKLKKERMEMQARSMQTQMMVEHILERTKSLNEEEFLERYRTATKLSDSLRAMQIQADVKALNLKAQLAELHVVWGETAVLEGDYVEALREKAAEEGKEAATGEASASPSRGPAPAPRGGAGAEGEGEEKAAEAESDGRHLDSAMFSAEMRLQQARRKLDQASHLINEIRLGVTTIMALLNANEKVLANLPKTRRPTPMTSDQDITPRLTWCEERITAMSEAMVLDGGGNKATAAAAAHGGKQDEEKLSVFQRQVNLAKLVHKMVKKSITHEESATKILTNKKKLKAQKYKPQTNHGLQRLLVDITDRNTVINSPRGVVIPNEYEQEHQYNVNVNKYLEQASRRAEVYEAQMAKKREQQALGDSHDVQRFLREALSGSQQSTTALRKSNFLSNRPIKGGLGFALEDLFLSNGSGTELQGMTGSVMPQLESTSRSAEQVERDRKRGRGGPKASRSGRVGGGAREVRLPMGKGKKGGKQHADEDEMSDDGGSLASSVVAHGHVLVLSDTAKMAVSMIAGISRVGTAATTGGDSPQHSSSSKNNSSSSPVHHH